MKKIIHIVLLISFTLTNTAYAADGSCLSLGQAMDYYALRPVAAANTSINESQNAGDVSGEDILESAPGRDIAKISSRAMLRTGLFWAVTTIVTWMLCGLGMVDFAVLPIGGIFAYITVVLCLEASFLDHLEIYIRSQPFRTGPTNKTAYYHRKSNIIFLNPYLAEYLNNFQIYAAFYPYMIVRAANHYIIAQAARFFPKTSAWIMKNSKQGIYFMDDFITYTIGALPITVFFALTIIPYLTDSPQLKKLKIANEIQKELHIMVNKLHQIETISEENIGEVEINAIERIFKADTYKYAFDKKTRNLGYTIATRELVKKSSYIIPRHADDNDEKEMACSIVEKYFNPNITSAEKKAIIESLLEEQAEYEERGECGWQWIIDKDKKGNILIDESHGLRSLHIFDREKLPYNYLPDKTKKGYFAKNIKKDAVDYEGKENVMEMLFWFMDRDEKVDIFLITNWPKNKKQGYRSYLAEGYFDLFHDALYQIEDRINIEIGRIKDRITDAMTSVYNYKYFQLRLNEEITRSIRRNYTLSLIMVDVDNFKKFNDNYGHQEGDNVLKGVTTIMHNNLRTADSLYRYGGEEFTIILPETDQAGAVLIAERIRKAIEKTLLAGKYKVTISIGISVFPLLAKNQVDLIKQADNAMYFSKGNGRNRSSVFQKPADNTAKPSQERLLNFLSHELTAHMPNDQELVSVNSDLPPAQKNTLIPIASVIRSAA